MNARRYFLAALLVFFFSALFLSLKPADRLATPVQAKWVYDGDTIQLSSGEKVRYIGIDSPELNHEENKKGCFADEATEENKRLVLNKKLSLSKDITDRDKYDRLLRYVYLEGGTFVNLELVRRGYAKKLTIPPDTKFQQDFKDAELYAKTNRLGLWGACR